MGIGSIAAAAVTTLALSSCGSATEEPAAKKPRKKKPTMPSEQVREDVAGPGKAGSIARPAPIPGEEFNSGVKKPNVLMVTVDDATRADLKYMPQLQKLVADSGLTLSNGIAPTPICVPARASLMTGKYARNHGSLTIKNAKGGFNSFNDEDTLAVRLQQRGYRTGFVGKYLNGYGDKGTSSYVPPGWSNWQATIDPSTYNFTSPRISDNGTEIKPSKYSSDILSDLAVEQIEENAASDKPWYLWVNYVAPHHGGPSEPDDPEVLFPDDEDPVSTTRPSDEDRDTFSDLELPDTPDMFEADTSDKFLAPKMQNTWTDDRKAQLKEANQQRVEALQSVDRGIARQIKQIKENGEIGDTYIIFTSDNGYVLGQHNLVGKLWHTPDILGIPMIIRGPGIPSGETSDTPVTNADWAPTIGALAGIGKYAGADGVNVLPWLTSKANARVIPLEAYAVFNGNRKLYSGTQWGPWTYVRNPKRVEELYNTRVDPWFNHNLSNDPRYQGKLRQMRKLFKKYVDCQENACPQDFYQVDLASRVDPASK